MLNSLLRLLDNYDYGYLERRLNEGFKTLNKVFAANFSSFEDKEDHYELVLDVADDAKASNVTVDYDDETRELTVEYKYESKNFTSRSLINETLPDNADEDTIEATVENGKLTIVVEKKAEPEVEEEVAEEDEKTVKINRK